MAWNDPGRNDDPWSRGSGQAPPDLDEAFRKFQAKLAGIFGGRGGGAGGKRGFNWKSIVIGLVVLAAAYGLSGIYQLNEQERGVIFRFGAVQAAEKQPGLRWRPRLIDELRRVNVTRVDSHSHTAHMLTEDNNIVDISLTVQYRIDNPIAYTVEVKDPLVSLENATESALRHVVGGTDMASVITEGRAALGAEVEERIQTYLDTYQTGIGVVTVNIDRSGPPAEVQEAFDDVQKAEEDKQRQINEADAYYERVVPTARGDAAKAVQEAEAYREQVIAEATGEAERFTKLLVEYQLAPRVTRDRLYIDSWESVLGQSSKVIVDVGDDNIMVLPLDRQGLLLGAMNDEQLRNVVSGTVASEDRGQSSRRGR